MAEALYRKYRPQIFEDVVGQEHIERTIKNSIEQDKVSHAYLFTGPRGTGKTTTARLLAKALLCEKGPTAEPDGTCTNCTEIANGTHPDVYELDAASRTGVENVREEIIGRVQFAPTRGRSKVYIIDEVHMLSTAAFNALLKTLEEPPSHVVFILCTTDPQKVPETIHSRCQRFDFRRISSEAIVSRLGAICVAEDVEFEGDALDLIAYRAEGGMRNALTSLEQLIAFGEGKVTLQTAERLLGSLDTNDMAEIVRAIGSRDIAQCFTWTASYIETGADLAQFTRDLAEHIRNMYILTLSGTDTAIEVSEATRRELTSEMELFGPDRLARLLGVLG
ncbi:MAG: DNA polymerase III subunit gamma/tau, partial [Raoultibacter sp.]